MTECPRCREPVPASSGRGRPRIFCSDSCREADEIERRRAAVILGRHFQRNFPGLATAALGRYVTTRGRGGFR